MDVLTIPVRQGTPEWLEARRQGIGGSDAAIVIGESPYRSPYDLWAEKCGLVAPAPETAAMAWGRRLEPLVAAAYTEATGRRLRRVSRLLRHRERPWQLASIDRAVIGEKRLVEIKTTRSPAGTGNSASVTGGDNWYPVGKSIPRPLLIRRFAGRGDAHLLGKEILALSKMNWNNDNLNDTLPSTLAFAHKLAEIVKRMPALDPRPYPSGCSCRAGCRGQGKGATRR